MNSIKMKIHGCHTVDSGKFFYQLVHTVIACAKKWKLGKIRPAAAFVRNHVIAGDGCIVGNSTELKNCLLFDAVQIPHFNYVGDSILESNITRRVDYALFMVAALENDSLICEAPAIVGCLTPSARAHAT